MSTLRDYLSGQIELTEFSPSSVVTGSVSPLSQPSVKAEKLGQLWDDLLIKLWALWSDVLDTNDKIYDEAKSTLDELKGMQPEQCKGALSNFKVLYRTLEKYQYVDKYTPQPMLKLFTSRMRYLIDELSYICDQYDPEIPRPPEAPIRSREEWDKAQVQKRKDAKSAEDGEMPDKGMPGEADIVFNPTQRKTSTTATFMPDRQGVGKDQAGSSGKTTARGKGSEKPAAKTSVKKSGQNPAKKADNKKPASSKQAKPTVKDKGSAKPAKKADNKKPGQKPAKKLKEWTAIESSLILESFVEASDRPEPEAEFLTIGETICTALGVCSDIWEARVEIGEATPGGLPRLDLYVEWFDGKRPTDVYGYARLWFNEDEGLYVMDACDRVRDVLRLDEEITDDHIAYRLYNALDEIYDPASTRVWEKARVVPALYRLLERFHRGESVPERAFAQIVDGLRGRLAVQENVRVPGPSIRLLTREAVTETDITSQRGGQLDYHYSWAVKTPLSHHQTEPNLDPFDGSMRDPAPDDEMSDLGLVGKEPYITGSAIATGQDAEARAGIDRWPFATWQSKVQAVKEALATVRGLAEEHPNDYAYQASVRQLEGRLQHLYDRPKLEAADHWRTPSLVIDLGEGCVYLEGRDGKEVLPKDTTDEDTAAKIASAAYRKESAEGPFCEPILNKPGSALNEIYARSGLELEKKTATYYVVYWHGKVIGRVEKHSNGLWSCHRRPEQPKVFEPDDKGEHAGPHPAAIALAKGQGLSESELSQKSLKILERLEDAEFDIFVEAVGLDPAASRFTNTVLYTRRLYELDFGDAWADTFSRQLENPDPAALTEALVFAVKEEGLSFGAIEWADQHWREFL